MPDIAHHRSYEELAATPEGAALLAYRNEVLTGESEGVETIERVLPDLTVKPAVPAQPAPATYSPETRAQVTDLAEHRQRSAVQDARAAVSAALQEESYGRAA